MIKDKIKKLPELLEIVKLERAEGRTIGFTNGCFDIIHSGHVKYLEEAAQKVDVLIVAVNSDASVKRIKGPGRPVNPEADRLLSVAALEAVSLVTLFDEDTPLEVIKQVIPDVLIKGGDWKAADVVGNNAVEAAGGKVVIIPYLKGYSTTEIIKKIKKIEE